MLIDGVAMKGDVTFDCLDRWLRAINRINDFDFLAVSFLIWADSDKVIR